MFNMFFSSDFTWNFDSIEVGGMCSPGISLTAMKRDHIMWSAALDASNHIIMVLQCIGTGMSEQSE